MMEEEFRRLLESHGGRHRFKYPNPKNYDEFRLTYPLKQEDIDKINKRIKKDTGKLTTKPINKLKEKDYKEVYKNNPLFGLY